jgi:hypothetical protein
MPATSTTSRSSAGFRGARSNSSGSTILAVTSRCTVGADVRLSMAFRPIGSACAPCRPGAVQASSSAPLTTNRPDPPARHSGGSKSVLLWFFVLPRGCVRGSQDCYQSGPGREQSAYLPRSFRRSAPARVAQPRPVPAAITSAAASCCLQARASRGCTRLRHQAAR